MLCRAGSDDPLQRKSSGESLSRPEREGYPAVLLPFVSWKGGLASRNRHAGNEQLLPFHGDDAALDGELEGAGQVERGIAPLPAVSERAATRAPARGNFPA
jgi:hypothetical protein